MLWKNVLFPKLSTNPLKFEALKALRTFSPCLNGNTPKLYSSKTPSSELGQCSKKVGFNLTPTFVHYTLANCSSDLVALSFFMWCARQNNYFHDRLAFTHMVPVVGRLVLKFDSVDEIVRQLKDVGCVIKAQTFLLLLRIFWLGGMYSLVFDVFEDMNKFGYTANTFVYNVIIDVSFKIGRKDVALRILKEIEVPNFLSFNIAVCNLCKLNDLENLQGVIRIMLRSGYYPDPKTFVKVLNCFCKKGTLIQTFQVLGLMIGLGIQVSVAVWNILIDGLCRTGRPVAASKILDKMIGSGCSPNVVTYTSLLKAFMEFEMVDDAFKILSMMEENGCEPDLFFSNILMHRLSKMGMYNKAVGIFFDLRKRNMKPDLYTFASLFSAIRLSGKFHLLPQLVKGVPLPADVVICNSLLSCLCKAGLSRHAVEFYHEMEDSGYTPDKYSYTELLVGLCRDRKIDEAVNLYQRMVMSHFNLDAYVHTVVIDGLIKVGKYHQAIYFFKQVLAKNYSLDVVLCTVSIEGLVRGNMVGEALTLYNKMKELGVSPNARIYNLMLSGLCKERDDNMVKMILQEMHDKGVKLEYKTCIRMSNVVFESRYYFPVFNLLVKMWDSGLVADNLMRILLLEGHSRGIIVGDMFVLLKRFVGDNSFIDTSRSKRYLVEETSSLDDLSVAVASVGC